MLPSLPPPGPSVRVTAALLAALTLVAGCGNADNSELPRRTAATVTRTVDGDTAEMRLADGSTETVRYIGVDTPESVKPDTPVQCYGLAASHFNERLVDGERVRLVIGEEARDPYGRLLAYVHLEDRFVNAELLRRGYATTLTIPPNDRYAGRFAGIERAAAREGRGLWGKCGV